MSNAIKMIARSIAGIIAVILISTCNIFNGEVYEEKNVSGYKPVPLESPRVVYYRLKKANPGKTDIQLYNEFPELQNSLNRLAFGVSSRTIATTPLSVPVYTDALPNGDSNFAPWGNIIMDSDEEEVKDEMGWDATETNGGKKSGIGFTPDPKMGAGRQIVLTAINQTNNAGKIAGSEDGITFYFKRVPKDVNFRISADFYINSYGFTGGRAELNGQEAFGFMARDWVPQHRPSKMKQDDNDPESENGSGNPVWPLKMEDLKMKNWNDVYWNGQDTSLNDGVASSSNMIMVGGVKRGMRVYWRTGVTDPDGQKKPVTDFNTIANADFAKFDYRPREMSDYSVYGSGIEGTKARPDFPTAGLTYKLYLEKTDSGFIARIEPPKGNNPIKGVTKTRVPSDGYVLEYNDRELCFPDMLCGPTSVEKDFYYVGLFAARDAKVTVTNLRYEESPADPSRRIDPEPEMVATTFTVQSPIATSIEDYIFYARSNIEGMLQLSVNGGPANVYQPEWKVETTNASAKPFSLFTVEGIKLKNGDNIFDMMFIPDKKQEKSGFRVPGDLSKGYEYQISSIKPITRSFIVNRRSLAGSDWFPFEGDTHPGRIKREVIWVSPTGKANGSGSKDNPLDLKTAITVSGPGQVIMLMDGVYTPMDPPEIIDGGMRIPIRLTIPRYNSGLPNKDDGAPDKPQPRPGPVEDVLNNTSPNAPYPDPYADPYYKYYKVLMAENRDKAIFDFRKDKRTEGYAPRNFENRGDYWIFDGFHVRNAEDNYGGFRTYGQNILIRWVKTYFNGDTGLWVTGSSDEPKSMWPTNIRVEYCESFGNADQSRTNADGFACKLTTWENIVFYRCISHHNIDDGWDFFAKKETGPIGANRIEQSFAYSNGRYLNDEMGRNYSEVGAPVKKNYSAGVGGNGFKMGGEGIPVNHHVLYSLTWGNDGDGVTSNSDPAIRITHVTAFDNYNRIDNNPGSNFAIYSSQSPSYEGLDAIITQVLSWRSEPLGARNDRAEPQFVASGYVWRNYLPLANYPSGIMRGIYDGNNGKDTALLTDPKADPPTFVRRMTGKSISTTFINRKYDQSGLWFSTVVSSADRVKVGPNSTSVNEYIDGREFTVTDFIKDPKDQFAYGTLDGPLGVGSYTYAKGLRRGIYYGGDTGEHVSPFGIPGDLPYRRLDGSVAPNRGDGKIEGDFMEVYQEGDTSVSDYYWGLPKLHDYLRLNPVGFPDTLPGAKGIWVE
jgi:hypothetical protein